MVQIVSILAEQGIADKSSISTQQYAAKHSTRLGIVSHTLGNQNSTTKAIQLQQKHKKP